MDITRRIAEHMSAAYIATIALRHHVLRAPLNMHFTISEFENENHDFHLYLEANDIVVACLVLSPKEDNCLKMRQVAVDPNFQSKGLGKQLVAFAEQVAKKEGFRKIVLHARETAVDFYTKQAYQRDGERFIEVGIPHYKFYKLLEN